MLRPQLRRGAVALLLTAAPGCRKVPTPTAATTPARAEPDATSGGASEAAPASDAPPKLMTLPEEADARADAIEAWVERLDRRQHPDLRRFNLEDRAILQVDYIEGQAVAFYLDFGIDDVEHSEETDGIAMVEGIEHERYRSYYLFNGELVAVHDHRKDTWVSGAEGTLWCPELDVEATVILRGETILRSEVIDDTPSECSAGGSDDGEEEPPPPPELPHYMSPSSLRAEVTHWLDVEKGNSPPKLPPDPLD